MAAILIVDDMAAHREFLARLLRDHGHRPLLAENGEEALTVVEAEVPDLVITDLVMPVMDGFELVRQLRAEPATKAVPVVFSTAHYDAQEAKELAVSSGVSHVLTKPTGSEEVLRVVDRVLAGSAASRAAAEDDTSLTTAFDREHLRLVTDKLSQNVGELKLTNTRLKALIDIGLDLASERDSDRVLHRVCEAARGLFDASYVTLGIVNRSARTVERVVSSGLDAIGWIRPGDAPPTLLRKVIDERRTLRGDNPYGKPAGLDLPAGHPVIQAYLMAPVASPGLVCGWICLANNEGRRFTDDDEQLLLALAGQVGRIYENGHYYRLAEAERDRAQRYLDTAEVILLALDLEGRITQANRYACSVLGWRAEDLLGRDWADTCLPERMRERFKRRFKTILAADSVVERPVLTRSGEERIIEWRNTVLRDNRGDTIGTFSSGTDVTVRVQAETALRQTKERLAFALRQSHTGGWELDLRDQIAYRTAEHDRIFGYESLRPTWTYDTFLEHIVPDDRAEVDRRFHEAVSTQTDWAFECRIRRVDGEIRWIWATGGHQLDDAGAPQRLAGIVQDITERKRAEEGRRIAEERATFALQNAGVGIWDMDFTTGVLRWSEILEGHYGVEPGTFAGTFEAFIERVHPDDRDSLLATIGKARDAGGDFLVEHRSLWPDGAVRWLNGRGRVLLNENGTAVRGVGISIDVTDRRNLEEQYRQAQKMEAVGRLAGGIAHDFNNLLGVIMGSSGLLLMDLEPGDPREEDLLEIQHAGERAAGLTRQLLAFSRKQIIEPTLLDLNVVLRDMLAMLRRLIGEDVSVMVATAPDPALVYADRGQVEQVVMNLAVNARDAMPGGGKLTVEVGHVELDEDYLKRHVGVNPGRFVALVVSDTGTGISPETQARLFEPFFTTKEVGKGTGLGLATVHGIVSGSGGTVDVYSELGVGTSFKVYLPRAEGSEDIVENPPSALEPINGTQTILLVEDEDGLRDTTTKLLRRMGYTVLVAAGAHEAIPLFEDHPDIDLILTDVVMPGESGPELARRLAAQRPSLRVLYMSGYTEEAIVHHGVLKPGIAFLNKPVTYESLGRKVREVLDR